MKPKPSPLKIGDIVTKVNGPSARHRAPGRFVVEEINGAWVWLRPIDHDPHHRPGFWTKAEWCVK